jgi:hypothetical protein
MDRPSGPGRNARADGGDAWHTRTGVLWPVAKERKKVSPAQDVPPEQSRRNYAPRGIAELLAPVVRPAFRRRAPAAAQLLADWSALAGPELSRRAAAIKFAGGTLTLACTGPAAMELQMLAPQIIARLNLALGQNMIERLRFVQQAPAAAAPSAARLSAPPVAPPENLPDGPLGEALARLYQGVKSRR